MPSLLSPAFLAGLFAIVVPILVHLRMRERRTAQPFPSLMFVRRIPHKSLRRRTLRNVLLFAARTLALALLCFAFARPFFPVKAGDASVPMGPLGRVIALDVSASMGYDGVFPRAVAEAERAIREARPADAVGLLLFSDRAQGLVPPSTDQAKALTALRKVSAGQRSTKFAPALRLSGDWLAALKADRREIVLITDGQARALAGVSEVALPPNTVVTVRSVAASNPDNSAVAEISVEYVKEANRGFAVVTARLVHQGAAERKTTAALEVAGRTIEERLVAIPANGAATVTFTRAPLPSGESRARILLKRDSLAVDDVFHFVLGSSGAIRVLVIGSSPYVTRALEIGTQPSFEMLQRPALVASDLALPSLVVLGDQGPAGPSPSARSALSGFVRAGGGLLITAPPAGGLRGDGAELLPYSWGESVSRLGDRGASLGFVDLDHPALFPFKQARGSDFSRARFLQYRRVKPRTGAGPEAFRVLARFDDGREALIESAQGSGRVLAFTTPLDGVTSDLPVQPLFLPLIHELARYAASYKEVPLAHRVGGAASLAGNRTGGAEDAYAEVVSPLGRRETLSGDASGIEIDEAGFYEVVRASGARRLIAANVDSAESDLTVLDQGELEAAVHPSGRAVEAAVAITPADAGARQSWWRLALLALGLLMLAESFLGNADGRKATP
jgi:hypothetical protein